MSDEKRERLYGCSENNILRRDKKIHADALNWQRTTQTTVYRIETPSGYTIMPVKTGSEQRKEFESWELKHIPHIHLPEDI